MKKFKIAYIGSSGHGPLAMNVDDAHKAGEEFVAYAPGSVGENVDGLGRGLEHLGAHPTRYDDYHEMLTKEDIDIVVVDNFYGDHAAAIIAALETGHNVFAEKPLATTLEDLAKVRAAYEEANKKYGVTLLAMMTFRYEPPFYTAWKMIRDGKIGEVRLINGQKSYKMGTRPEFAKARKTYGGTIPWVGIHAIDWVYWMSGKHFVSATAAQSRDFNQDNGNLETDALVLYELEDGVLGSVTMDYLNPKTSITWGDDRVRVVGTEGVLEVRHGELFYTAPSTEGAEKIEPDTDTTGIFENFMDHLEGKCDVRLSAEDSLYITEAALRAQLAADEGNKVQF